MNNLLKNQKKKEEIEDKDKMKLKIIQIKNPIQLFLLNQILMF